MQPARILTKSLIFSRHQMPSRNPSSSLETQATGRSRAEAEARLAKFIAKFEERSANLIVDCRKRLKALLPTATELVYDNYNFFVIGYCSSERASDCIVSIAAAANGVGLSFYQGASLPDPSGLLEGSGKQNRFIRLPNSERLNDPEIVRLIQLAANHGKIPLPPTGEGQLTIKSVSLKQKPRRRS
jgi:hypothetical protein